MKVFIVGLGLMGASYALALKDKHEVDGYDVNPEITSKALDNQDIKTGNINQIKVADVIVLALYPKENVEFIKTYRNLLNPKQLITDLSGTKGWMVEEIESILDQSMHYVSHHPMAGREISGYDARNKEMFVNANFLIVPTKRTRHEDTVRLKTLASDMNFGRITEMNAYEHDNLIGFTSQLTHVIAVSLVNSDRLKHTKDATGDSYRDLTRIAKINEVMWSELFLENKEALLNNMEIFLEEIGYLKQLIEKDEEQAIQVYLKKAKEKRKLFD